MLETQEKKYYLDGNIIIVLRFSIHGLSNELRNSQNVKQFKTFGNK